MTGGTQRETRLCQYNLGWVAKRGRLVPSHSHVLDPLIGLELSNLLLMLRQRLRIRIQLLLDGFQRSEESCHLALEGFGVALFRGKVIQEILVIILDRCELVEIILVSLRCLI